LVNRANKSERFPRKLQPDRPTSAISGGGSGGRRGANGFEDCLANLLRKNIGLIITIF
jgi:hypothetical protein